MLAQQAEGPGSRSGSQGTGSNPHNHQSAGNLLLAKSVLFTGWAPGTMPNGDNFDEEWNLFVKACGLSKQKSVFDAKKAWKAFSDVLEFTHADEKIFSDTMFAALTKALGTTWDAQNSTGTTIVLKNQSFGFAANHSRTHLGFSGSYGISKNNICVHCVVVFGGKDGTFKRHDGTKITTYEHNDLTAIVELKMSNKSCNEVKTVDYGSGPMVVDIPDLTEPSGYGPLAQTIFYSIDVLNCLVRRGRPVAQIPLTLLAAINDTGKRRKVALPDIQKLTRLRCVDACLNIPQTLGVGFKYTIKHQIPFSPATTARTAAAMYLRALREGVEHANAIVEGCQRKPWPNPTSLCGVVTYHVTFRNIEATGVSMIASPIPGAHLTLGENQEPFEESIADVQTFSTMSDKDTYLNQKNAVTELHERGTDESSDAHGGQANPDQQCSQVPWSVHQGELFRCDSATFSTKLMGGAVFSKGVTAARLLIKISWATVHSTLVPLHACLEALSTLSSDSEQDLKDVISKVLLAVACDAAQGTMVTVMKDLTLGGYTDSGDDSIIPFGPLEHGKIRQENKLSNLWSAFGSLLENILHPMAEQGIAHLDIRPCKDETYNILIRSVGDIMELRLVDYESVARIPITFTPAKNNHPAIHPQDLPYDSKAFDYLWWQTLWIAFVWQSRNPLQDSTEFVKSLFTVNGSPVNVSFQRFVSSDAWDSLSSMRNGQNGITAANIMTTIKLISEAFSSLSQQHQQSIARTGPSHRSRGRGSQRWCSAQKGLKSIDSDPAVNRTITSVTARTTSQGSIRQSTQQITFTMMGASIVPDRLSLPAYQEATAASDSTKTTAHLPQKRAGHSTSA
jgi:hypothetical protein